MSSPSSSWSSYQVRLVGLHSLDHSNKDVLKDHDVSKTEKWYQPPANMSWDWAKTSRKNLRVDDPYHLQNFGLIQRKILSSPTIKSSSPIRLKIGEMIPKKHFNQFTLEAQKEFINNYFDSNSPPNLITNVSNLKSLMTLSNNLLMTASKINLHNGQSSLYLKSTMKCVSNPNTFGYRNENFLSTGDPNKVVNQNHVLEAVYSASIGELQIGFTGETDGIMKKSQEERDIKINDLVEVKCLQAGLFYAKSKNNKNDKKNNNNLIPATYFYEENVLREAWAHCSLRGIDKLLCGVVEKLPNNNNSSKFDGIDDDNDDVELKNQNQVHELKEIWLYNVKEIPMIISNPNASVRCFPKVHFSHVMNEIEDKSYQVSHNMTDWNKWNPESEYQTLYQNLCIINNAFLDNSNNSDSSEDQSDDCDSNDAKNGENGTKYFIYELKQKGKLQDSSSHNPKIILQITKEEYELRVAAQTQLQAIIYQNSLNDSPKEILKGIMNVLGIYSKAVCQMNRKCIKVQECIHNNSNGDNDKENSPSSASTKPTKSSPSFLNLLLTFSSLKQREEFFHGWLSFKNDPGNPNKRKFKVEFKIRKLYY